MLNATNVQTTENTQSYAYSGNQQTVSVCPHCGRCQHCGQPNWPNYAWPNYYWPPAGGWPIGGWPIVVNDGLQQVGQVSYASGDTFVNAYAQEQK